MVRRCATLFLLALGIGLCLASDQGCVDGDDGGAPAPQPAVDASGACAALITKTCGDSNACIDDGWCIAAGLLQGQDPTGERCYAALQDENQYPPCTNRVVGSYCDELVDLVCGALPDRKCEGQFACANAKLLKAGGSGVEDAGDTEARCLSALRESALYPPCAP